MRAEKASLNPPQTDVLAVAEPSSSGSPVPDFGKPNRIPELDGLRGFAIFLVILDHYIALVPDGPAHSLASTAGHVMGLGASGVDLFFILSGFLIGGMLLDSRSSPNYYRTFYLRRLHRIVPLYYVWIALFFVASLWSKDFILLRPYWVYFLFLQNYFYGQTPMQSTWLNATWSLAVEEQFYLMVPPCIRNVRSRHLAQVLLGVVAGSLAVRFFTVLRFGDAAHEYWGRLFSYYATPSRADDLAVGVLIALALRSSWTSQWITKNASCLKVMLAGGLVALVASLKLMLSPDSIFPHTIGFLIFSVIYGSALMICLTDKQSILAPGFRLEALRELGRVSYCVYIIHQAMNWMVHKYVRGDLPRFDSPGSIATTLLALGATILVAELSWHFFEHPLILRGHRYKY